MGTYTPYPLFTIEARDEHSGSLLAQTRVVAPTATEMRCKNCHGSKWRVDGKVGFTAETAADILAVHDKTVVPGCWKWPRQASQNSASHATRIRFWAPKASRVLNFPVAIHGWHANHLTNRGTEAYYNCHPSAPNGPTQYLRGVHAAKADCTTCHVTIEDHALSLLKAEQLAGKKGARRLMRHLQPRKIDTLAKIHPRSPWVHG